MQASNIYSSLIYFKKLNNVSLLFPFRYVSLRDQLDGIEILIITSGKHDADCKCCLVNVEEALQSILGTQFVREKLEFPSTIQQEGLSEILRSKNPDLFSALDPQRRTLFLRQTSENLRGAGSHPTEQLSFSILNLKILLNSPFGQHITGIFRRKETRANLIAHGHELFRSLVCLARE